MAQGVQEGGCSSKTGRNEGAGAKPLSVVSDSL